MNKAIDYFTKNIFDHVILPVHKHMESLAYKTKVKKYLGELEDYLETAWAQVDRLYHASFLGEAIFTGERTYRKDILTKVKGKSNAKKSKKGSTLEDTLVLFDQGKSIDQIAGIRGLTQGTIESHLARLIGQGKLAIKNVMPDDRVEKISFYMLNYPDLTMTELKAKIPVTVDYSDLRMVKAHLDVMKKQ